MCLSEVVLLHSWIAPTFFFFFSESTGLNLLSFFLFFFKEWCLILFEIWGRIFIVSRSGENLFVNK